MKIKLIRGDPLLQSYPKDHPIWEVFDLPALEAVVDAEIVDLDGKSLYEIPRIRGSFYIPLHHACIVPQAGVD